MMLHLYCTLSRHHLVCLLAGGYSGIPVDGKDECVSFPGFDHHLCMAWRQDNAGPHSAEEVESILMKNGQSHMQWC